MNIELRYIGSAVQEGRMNARLLGPGILGVAEILEGVAEAIYGDRKRLSVEVEADFQHGSFVIDFVAGPNTSQLLTLGLEEIANIAQIAGVVGTTAAWSVAGLIKWQRGRKIKRAEATDRGVTISVHADQIVVGEDVFKAFANSEVRQGFDDLVKPLIQDGIESLEIGTNHSEKQIITAQEAPYFRKSLTPQKRFAPVERNAFLEVLSPTFKEGNKWEFQQGNQTYHAEIQDQEFLAKVRRREIRFGQGDTIRVRMRVEEFVDERGVHPTRKILQVLQYYPSDSDDTNHHTLL